MANRIEIIIDSVTEGLEKGLKKSDSGLAKFGKSALFVGGAVAGGLAVGLEKSVHAAIEAQQAEARLTQAYKNAHVAIGPLKDELDRLEASGRKLGFTDDDTVQAMGSLITATRNQKRAVEDLSVAQDLARFKNVNLQDATKMLTMAMTGSQRAAKQLGISVEPVTKTYDTLKATMGKTIDASEKLRLAHAKLTDKQLTGIAVVDAVRDHVKGQGKAFADTAAGGMAQFHAELNHIEIEIGQKLLPAIANGVAWIRKHWPEIALTIHNSWVQIQPDLAAFRESVKQLTKVMQEHWATVRPIFKIEGDVVSATMNTIAGVLRFVTFILKGEWASSWAQAKNSAVSAMRTLSIIINAPARLSAALIDGITSALRALAGWLAHKFEIKLDGVIGAVKDLYHWIQNVVGSIGDLNRALSNIHVPHIHIPGAGILSHIPKAMGGSVRVGQSYLVGERGPELFTSNRAGSIVPNHALGGGGGTVVFNFPNYIGSRSELKQAMREAARSFSDLNGRGIAG